MKATQLIAKVRGLRIGYFASARSALSDYCLLELINRSITPVALFLPTFAGTKDNNSIYESDRQKLSADAHAETVKRFNGPIIAAGKMDQTIEKAVRELDIDLILSVCFPRKIPRSLLSTARFGGINLHPSPLPAWRGPDPIFWQLRAGRPSIGISLHRMTENMDRGAVIAANAVIITRNMDFPQLTRAIARSGIDCLVTSEAMIRAGHVTSHCVDRGQWFRAPTAPDYRVWPVWSVEHASTFIRLLQHRKVKFTTTDTLGVTVQFNGLAAKDLSQDNVTVLKLSDGDLTVAEDRQGVACFDGRHSR